MSNPVHGTARHELHVTVETDKGPKQTAYVIRFLESAPKIGQPAWELAKYEEDGELSEAVYHVIVTPNGVECDCADYTFRRHNKPGGGCKHIKACRAGGLLSERLLEVIR
jgi:hypothetical protein